MEIFGTFLDGRMKTMLLAIVPCRFLAYTRFLLIVSGIMLKLSSKKTRPAKLA